MTEPASHRSRGWPLVILAGLVVLLLFAVLLPLGEMFAGQGDEIVQARLDLAVFRAQIAAAPRLRENLKTLDDRETQTGALLPGASTALAAAGMQSLVKALVEHHSGQIRSAQTMQGSTSNGMEKVVVQYEVSLPLGALRGALHDLESQTPFLFVDDIEIKPELYAAGAATTPSDLHVQWTLHGYRRSGAP